VEVILSLKLSEVFKRPRVVITRKPGRQMIPKLATLAANYHLNSEGLNNEDLQHKPQMALYNTV
jgi:hypothetical protein